MTDKHESRAKNVLGGSHKPAKSGGHKHGKHPHEIHVRPGHSGGFIAKHIHKHKMGEEPQEPEEHVLADKDQMMQHVDENTPDDSAGAASPPAGGPEAAPAPSGPPGGAPAPGGM